MVIQRADTGPITRKSCIQPETTDFIIEISGLAMTKRPGKEANQTLQDAAVNDSMKCIIYMYGMCR